MDEKDRSISKISSTAIFAHCLTAESPATLKLNL